MTPDIKAIKAAAEAATPGPWVEAGPSYGEPKPRFFNSVVTEEDEDGDWLDICCSTSDNTDADMTHIATANPATVIALCDEIERLKDCLKKANDQAEHFEREWYLRGDELDRLRSTINEFHHAIKDAGWHPGRTDDLLTDIIRAKGVELAQLQEQNIYLDKVSAELQDLCDRQAKRLAEAEKDAASQFKDVERYRFLRDMDHWPAVFTSSNSPEPTRGNELDECIDKEMESKT